MSSDHKIIRFMFSTTTTTIMPDKRLIYDYRRANFDTQENNLWTRVPEFELLWRLTKPSRLPQFNSILVGAIYTIRPEVTTCPLIWPQLIEYMVWSIE
jgi:hypothetical protein